MTDLSDPFGGPLDYTALTAMATRDRPAKTLIAMSHKNDPYYVTPGRRAAAKWFSELWREHCQHRPNMHLRVIHYLLVSLENRPYRNAASLRYENTDACFQELISAARDARLLDLVPIDRIDDRRNDTPVEHLPNYTADNPSASLTVSDGRSPDVDVEPLETIDEPAPGVLAEEAIEGLTVVGVSAAPAQLEMPDEIQAPDLPEADSGLDAELLIPMIGLSPPRVTPPWFHLEIWCEKTSMNHIMLEIARDRRLNLITGPGFQSLTGSHLLIERAKRSGRPVRVLYISDHDSAGEAMPVAVARQIEFLLHRERLDLDIKLMAVALTHSQCAEYRLPRMPMKDTVKGKRAFEERYGEEGATELDALEAIHPGELRRILVREIDRYSDPTFPDRMQQAEDRVETGLNRIRAGIVAPHQEELDRLAAAPQELVEQRNAEVKAFVAERVDALNARIRELAEGPVESMNERLADVQEQANSIDDEIRELFAPRIAPLNEVIEGVRQDAEALDAEVRRVGAEGIAEINAAIREINERYETQLSDVTDRVEEIQREIHDDLENATSSALDGIEWPQPEEEDASAEPLFDSTRTYLEQMNVYKRHQGRATARKINRNRGQPWSSKRRAADKRVLKPRGGQP